MTNISKHYITLEKGTIYICGTWDSSTESESLSVIGCLRAGGTIITLDKSSQLLVKGLGLSHKCESMDMDQSREAVILACAAAGSGEPVVIAMSISRSTPGGHRDISGFLKALLNRAVERNIPLAFCGAGTPWLFSLTATEISDKKEGPGDWFPRRPSDIKSISEKSGSDEKWLISILNHPVSPICVLDGPTAEKVVLKAAKPFMASRLEKS
jgi:hypothetical protein